VYKDLCETVEEWIELLHKDGAALPEPLPGKAFSGRFVLRVEPALHRRLAAKALAAGESLNSYCARTLCKS
ncbi:MAG: toxin-antitoxin system HicB family antitoxin, partial [Verrucomicrobiota bacterium]